MNNLHSNKTLVFRAGIKAVFGSPKKADITLKIITGAHKLTSYTYRIMHNLVIARHLYMNKSLAFKATS